MSATEGADHKDSFFAGLFGAIITAPFLAAFLIPLVLYQGWAVWMLWQWFATKAGAPAIDYITAVGITLIANLLTNNHSVDPNQTRYPKSQFAGYLVAPAVSVAMGWAINSLSL